MFIFIAKEDSPVRIVFSEVLEKHGFKLNLSCLNLFEVLFPCIYNSRVVNTTYEEVFIF